MRTFKYFDVILQLILIAGGIIYELVPLFSRLAIDNQFWPYFMVGGWQLSSFTFHLMAGKKFIARPSRRQYGIVVFWLVISGIVLLILLRWEIPFIIFYLYGLLLFSPFLSLWYVILSYHELKLMNQRALIHLK